MLPCCWPVDTPLAKIFFSLSPSGCPAGSPWFFLFLTFLQMYLQCARGCLLAVTLSLFKVILFKAVCSPSPALGLFRDAGCLHLIWWQCLWKFWYSGVLELRSSNQGTRVVPFGCVVCARTSLSPSIWSANKPAGFCAPGQFCTEDVDECQLQPNACQNGGTCTNHNGGYACVCVNGWSGDDCSKNIDDCFTASCANGSTCIDRVASFSCICPEGKAGEGTGLAWAWHFHGRCFLGFTHLFKMGLFRALLHQKEKHCPWAKSC